MVKPEKVLMINEMEREIGVGTNAMKTDFSVLSMLSFLRPEKLQRGHGMIVKVLQSSIIATPASGM